jgi:hypothetical protein
MLEDPFRAAMGITAYVVIVFVKACELGLGGAITLADVREPAVVILCKPCGRPDVRAGAFLRPASHVLPKRRSGKQPIRNHPVLLASQREIDPLAA